MAASASLGSSAVRGAIGLGRFGEVPLRLVDLSEGDEVPRLRRAELRRFPGVPERRVQVSVSAFDDGKLAIEKRAVRRLRKRPLVNRLRLSQPTCFGRLPCRIHVVLHPAQAKDVDARAQLRQVRIGGNRRFETGERLLALSECEQRLAPAGERRCVSSVGGEGAIEVRRRRPIVLPGERHVAETRL